MLQVLLYNIKKLSYNQQYIEFDMDEGVVLREIFIETLWLVETRKRNLTNSPLEFLAKA